MTASIISCDTILEWMRQQAESKSPIDPMRWLEAAEKMNSMMGEETDKLIDIDHKLAEVRYEHLTNGDSAAKARMAVEAHPFYPERQRQKAKIDRIIEAIRLAKLHGRLKSDELRQGL